MRDINRVKNIMLGSIVRRMLQFYGRRFPILRGKMRIIRLVEKIFKFSNGPILCESNLGYSMMCSLDDWIQWQIFYFGDYLNEAKYARFLKRVLKPGDNVIDIGANVGYYTLLFSMLVGTSDQVWSFEPQPDTYNKLISNIKLNRIENVKTYNLALGRSDGFVQISIPQSSNTGTARIVKDNGLSEVVGHSQKMITLDSIINKESPNTIDWVKIDVEGFEMEVLKGSVETLSTYHPNFLIEVNGNQLNAFGYDVADLYGFMKQHGYQAYILQDDTLKPAKVGTQANIIVFQHKKKTDLLQNT